jgi:hypothetical protein
MRLLALLPLLAACAPTASDLADQRALAEARPIGEPVDCLPLQTIRNTRVRSDRVIDFEATGGRTYRNTLPASCPGLAFQERFTYRTSVGRLCSVDTITVLHAGGPPTGATCGLGPFQQIERPRR